MTQEAKPFPYLLSLEVENLRCFKSRQTLNTSRSDGHPARWTVLLGDNGVGKTTLLQAAAVCGRRGADDAVNLLHNEKNSVAASIGYLRAINDQNKTIEAVRAGRHKVVATYVATQKPEPVFRFMDKIGANWINTGPEGTYVAGSATPEHKSYFIAAYGASRLMSKQGDTSIATPKDAPSPVATLFSFDNRLQNAEEWLLKADYSSRVESPLQARSKIYLEKVTTALLSILPDVESISIIPPITVGSRPSVQFTTAYGKVSLNQLSLGYQTMIGWVTDFASRMFEHYPDSENPLIEPALCLVDEIDLHLHPRWQREIMNYLSNLFPNTQFIVTAHSPLIVLAEPEVNIAVLKREGDQVVIRNDVESVRNWRVDQVLTSDLFGLETARSPEMEKLLARKSTLMGKSRLTKKDKEEVADIDRRIAETGDLPIGETDFDRRAMDLIRRVGDKLAQRKDL